MSGLIDIKTWWGLSPPPPTPSLTTSCFDFGYFSLTSWSKCSQAAASPAQPQSVADTNLSSCKSTSFPVSYTSHYKCQLRRPRAAIYGPPLQLLGATCVVTQSGANLAWSNYGGVYPVVCQDGLLHRDALPIGYYHRPKPKP